MINIFDTDYPLALRSYLKRLCSLCRIATPLGTGHQGRGDNHDEQWNGLCRHSKRGFAFFDEGLDAFLAIWMSGAIADALSFQFQLCFQSSME